jgi:hypothetical protein
LKNVVYPDLLQVPQEATNVIKVEGLPEGIKEREVAHIFRPFIGFKAVKISKSPDQESNSSGVLCLVDFETTMQTTAVINTI